MFVHVTVFFDKSDENVGKIEKFGINAINPENQAKSQNCEHTLQKSRDFPNFCFKNVQTLRNLEKVRIIFEIDTLRFVMCCTFRQNCMEMLPRVAFSNKSERKRMKVYGTDTVQKHRDLTKY